MRRLRATVRLLATVLLALGAPVEAKDPEFALRVVVSGINAVIGLTGAILAGLLVFSLLLARQGRLLEPTSRRELRD